MKKMLFTQIPDKVKYPNAVKGKLSTLHSDIITYIIEHFNHSSKFKSDSIKLLNTVSYIVVLRESFPIGWKTSDPFDKIEFIDDDICKSNLNDCYLPLSSIVWDIDSDDNLDRVESNTKSTNVARNVESRTASSNLSASTTNQSVDIGTSSKLDLYIQPPVIPQLDTTQVWMSGKVEGSILTIYKSLPEIPKVQNQISVTTDIDKMTRNDLMNLYPTTRIKTRYPSLYSCVEGIPYDDVIGCITPVVGFTEEQVRDNIIKYPHFFKLRRMVNGKIVNFYNTIEIDGELHKLLDIWDRLPESRCIPRQLEFMKDYVIRRYLLERDIQGVQHKYPLFGTLNPYLTLFTSSDEYLRLGYTDLEGMARQCVMSRVSYKQSRNPIIRRLNANA